MNEFSLVMTFSFTAQLPEVRTLVDRQGEPWFVAKDICDILDIKNATQAVDRLDDDERAMSNIGLKGEINIINESGLFSLIIRSDKPQAKVFRKWVTSEVLPAIRKNGFYGSQGNVTVPEDPEQAFALWAQLDRRLQNHLSICRTLRDGIKGCLSRMKQHAPVYQVPVDPQLPLLPAD